jgi:hypothetical protein
MEIKDNSMKQLSIVLAIAGGVTLTTFGSDFQKQQQQHCQQQASFQMNRGLLPVSQATMHNLDPYNQRQAQQYNQSLAAQQAAFIAQATGQKK